MNLSSDPKPVKFRIVSGGEEHSSLDSLRNNFCISDLQKIEDQFKRWLRRQGKEGDEIAGRLNLYNLNSAKDFFDVYKLFFQKEFKEKEIETPSKLLKYLYRNKNTLDAKYLAELGFEEDDDITRFCYEKREEDAFKLTENWYTTLKKIRDKEGIEPFSLDKEVRRVLKRRNIKYDDSSFTKYKKAVAAFIKACCDIVTEEMYYIDARKNLGMDLLPHYENKYDIYRKDDFLFDAKFFVFFLMLNKQLQIGTENEWVIQYLEGISLEKRNMILEYIESDVDLYNLIKKFKQEDLFIFLELE